MRPHRRAPLALGLLVALALPWLVVACEAEEPRPGGDAPGGSAPADWAAFSGSEAEVARADQGRDDDDGTLARALGDGRVVLWRRAGLVPPEPATDGASWQVRVWVRSSRSQQVTLRVFEREDTGPVPRGRSSRTVPADEWVSLQSTVRLEQGGGSLGARIVLPDARAGDRVAVDDADLSTPGQPDGQPDGGTDDVAGSLSNGCELSARGVPRCGTLLGAAVGGNSDPSSLEEGLGRRLGVRRTFWGPGDVDEAVQTASGDLAAGRLPWISFKLPRSWEEMDSDFGESWARGVAERLAGLDGPVWIALHHEPEGDGDIQAWKRMQERLIPVVREAAPNVAYTVVLTGYAQFNGPPQYGLTEIFPEGDVDVAGFDIYNQYGVLRNGTRNTEGTDVDEQYFEKISAWAEDRGVAWGLAETGYSDLALDEYPGWIQESYDALSARGGVAYAYFDSTLNSKADWDLSEDAKREDFRRALEGAPQFPRW